MSLSDQLDVLTFTDAEWDLFETRVEEGYDLPPRGRYLQWLDMCHPELLSQGMFLLMQSSNHAYAVHLYMYGIIYMSVFSRDFETYFPNCFWLYYYPRTSS